MSKPSHAMNQNQVEKTDPVNAAAIKALIKDLKCGDVIKCQKARRALVEMGSPAVPFLIEALKTGKGWVRWEAAKALGEIGDGVVVKALSEALRDKMFEVRWLAAEGLINVGHRSIIPVVEALIDHSDSLPMREGAHHVLHDLSLGRFKEPLRPLLEALEGIEPAVVIPAVSRAVLETLHPIEAEALREDEEAEQKAREEAEAAAQMEAHLKKELATD